MLTDGLFVAKSPRRVRPFNNRTKRRLDRLRGERRHQQPQGDERIASEVLSYCRSVPFSTSYLLFRAKVLGALTVRKRHPPAVNLSLYVKNETCNPAIQYAYTDHHITL